MDIEVIHRFGSTGTPFLGHGGHRDQDKVVVDTRKQRFRTRHEQTPASMSGDTGITGRLDLRWNLAGGRNSSHSPFGDKGSTDHFFDDFDYH
jgi:hypothetical protein